ncbi:MAG TPA: glycosyltransferase [Ferruginibacter sp.]|nr:glycosyltransferase [Ferruginibacter sp.]
MTPFISICIPTYKRTHLLKKLLDSIRIQTFKDVEILVNDNSPDDSVEGLLSNYPDLNIQYVKNEPVVSAVENGIKVMQRAKGEWIKLVHDDDWFATPDALNHFADAAKISGKDFIFSAFTYVELETRKEEYHHLSGEHATMLNESVQSLFYLNVIGHPSVVMHKNYPGIEYDPSFNWVLDIDFYMRYLDRHPGYHYIDERLVNIGKGPTQESYKYYKNSTVEIPEYFRLLEKYDPSLSVKNKYVFWLVWNMVKRYKIKNEADVRKLGYDGAMPAALQRVIQCQKNIPGLVLKQTPWSKKLMERCFKSF